MAVGDICTRDVIVAELDETVADAARRMAEHRVGCLVVVDDERRPIGMLTDRDIVTRCVATDRLPKDTQVRVVMTTPVVSVRETTSLEMAVGQLVGVAARRLAVIGARGRLVGVLSMDDLLDQLTGEASAIAKLLERRQRS